MRPAVRELAELLLDQRLEVRSESTKPKFLTGLLLYEGMLKINVPKLPAQFTGRRTCSEPRRHALPRCHRGRRRLSRAQPALIVPVRYPE